MLTALGMRRQLAAGLVAAALALPLLTGPTAPSGGADAAVIVRARPGSLPAVEQVIARLGGSVERRLGIIDGVRAVLPRSAVAALEAVADVVAVTPDATLRPMAYDANLGYDPTGDTGSLSSITRVIGAQAAWDSGLTGRGIEVALIDTGVTPVEGLKTSGKVVQGPDLSFDSQDRNFARLDTYGHGTHLAGIIAGRDSSASDTVARTPCATCTSRSMLSDTTKFVGVAPNAAIVNVKVGATDGATDVSQVIAAIEWVITHGQDPGRNIKVINLSYGTDGLQDYTLDPLAYAVEVAWHRGIFVSVSAGNDGTTMPELANPASDPWIMAVGASDSRGTIDRADDVVPSFASRSTTKRNVDLVAPGVSVLSLNVPGSFVAETNPGGLVGTRFLRGSGTSQSAAVMSGAAALLYQKFPTATPDQIKALLIKTAYALPLGGDKPDQGKGLIDLAKAITTKLPDVAKSKLATATGGGSIEASRGSAHVTDGVVELTGEQDIFGQTWDPAVWAAAVPKNANWKQGTWRGKRMTGDGWLDSLSWSTADSGELLWNGSRWTGSRWTSMVWDGSRWTGDGWNGSRWTGSRWTGSRWTSSDFTGRS